MAVSGTAEQHTFGAIRSMHAWKVSRTATLTRIEHTVPSFELLLRASAWAEADHRTHALHHPNIVAYALRAAMNRLNN